MANHLVFPICNQQFYWAKKFLTFFIKNFNKWKYWDHNPNRSYDSSTSRPIGAKKWIFRPISERIHIFNLDFGLSWACLLMSIYTDLNFEKIKLAPISHKKSLQYCSVSKIPKSGFWNFSKRILFLRYWTWLRSGFDWLLSIERLFDWLRVPLSKHQFENASEFSRISLFLR